MGEIQRWRRFLDREPFLADRMEVMAANQMALLANINRAKNARPFPPTDFMPFLGPLVERARLDQEIRARGVTAEDEEDAMIKRLILGAGGSIG